MMKKICFCMIMPFIILIYSSFVNACEMTMGYRLNDRPPLIGEYPNNSGLYFDLYTQALEKINCTLKVIREPKQRLLHKLKSGDIDFYPGFTFTTERASYMYFMKNGLLDSYTALSAPTAPPMNDMSVLKDKVLLLPHGGPLHNADNYGAIIREVEDLDIARAIKLLQKNRGDYFIYNTESIKYFLKLYPTEIAMRPCCGTPTYMYLGFSKKSGHIKLNYNPDFLPERPISIDNYPENLDPSSNAKKLEQALQIMITNGEVNALYERYYGASSN